MEVSLRSALRAVMVMLSVVALLACQNCVPAEPTEGFVILRDPGLGKPLVSWRTPPKDADGRQAVDVLEQFLTHLRDGDVDSAKRLCRFTVSTGIDRGTMGYVTKEDLSPDAKYAQQARAKLAASEALFPTFVEELRRAKKYTLGATVKQKSVYWTIRVEADGVEKQPWPYVVYLCYEDNTWRIDVPDLTKR